MAHVGQEFAFGAVGGLGGFLGLNVPNLRLSKLPFKEVALRNVIHDDDGPQLVAPGIRDGLPSNQHGAGLAPVRANDDLHVAHPLPVQGTVKGNFLLRQKRLAIGVVETVLRGPFLGGQRLSALPRSSRAARLKKASTPCVSHATMPSRAFSSTAFRNSCSSVQCDLRPLPLDKLADLTADGSHHPQNLLVGLLDALAEKLDDAEDFMATARSGRRRRRADPHRVAACFRGEILVLHHVRHPRRFAGGPYPARQPFARAKVFSRLAVRNSSTSAEGACQY